MDELQEVTSYDEAVQLVGDALENYSAESPTVEDMQQVAEEAANGAASDVAQQVTESVEGNNDFLVSQITESVTSAMQEDNQAESTTIAAIEQTQYDEMVAAYRNVATLMFAQTLLVAMIVGCLVFEQFRGRWG